MSTPSVLAPSQHTGPACCEGEEWKPVQGWPHEASTCGRVRSIDRLDGNGVWRLGAILPQHPDKRKGKGYLYVMLRDGKRRRKAPVAHVVLEAHDKPKPGPEYEACHGNGKTDNHLPYLRWDTKEANLAEMWEARRAVTTRPRDTSQHHKPQVRRGWAFFPVCHSPSVTGDGSHGTRRFRFLSAFSSYPLSLKPSLRALHALRSSRRTS